MAPVVLSHHCSFHEPKYPYSTIRNRPFNPGGISIFFLSAAVFPPPRMLFKYFTNAPVSEMAGRSTWVGRREKKINKRALLRSELRVQIFGLNPD